MIERRLLDRVSALSKILDALIGRFSLRSWARRRAFDPEFIFREFAAIDLGIISIVIESDQVIRDLMRELEQADSGLVALVSELETQKERLEAEKKKADEAAARIKKLEGMIPICSFCKKIRNDRGDWEAVERYVQEHTEARFSHGLCPECRKKEYPDF